MTAWCAVRFAQSLAAGEVASDLPCPLCGASIRAVRLDEHLRKAHARSAGASQVPLDHVRWRGRDPSRGTLLVCLALVTAAAAGAVWRGTGDVPLAVVVGALGCALALGGGIRRATVTVSDIGVTTRRPFRRDSVVKLPAQVTIGSLQTSRVNSIGTDPDGYGSAVKVRYGTYLQVIGGRTAVAIGCRKKGATARKHLVPLHPVKARSKCDVELRGEDFQTEHPNAADLHHGAA